MKILIHFLLIPLLFLTTSAQAQELNELTKKKETTSEIKELFTALKVAFFKEQLNLAVGKINPEPGEIYDGLKSTQLSQIREELVTHYANFLPAVRDVYNQLKAIEDLLNETSKPNIANSKKPPVWERINIRLIKLLRTAHESGSKLCDPNESCAQMSAKLVNVYGSERPLFMFTSDEDFKDALRQTKKFLADSKY
ncbi:MAG: hypothetical protein K2X90_00775 [Candidatus Babeliaceae bacterium]|nr:hypothetical protein [Candidatus Babeliaceae bacterium]